MKIRNIFIIIILSYVLMLVVFSFIELGVVSTKARELQIIIRTAGDMALEQAQVIDDFMTYGGRDSYTLNMPSANGDGFVETDLFGGVFGLDSNVETNKEDIFLRLYKNDDFSRLAQKLDAMRRPIRYWNATKTGFEWYYMPQVAMIGTDILPANQSITGIKDSRNNYINPALSSEIMQVYELDKHVRMSGGKEYYTTPLNIGITYLNKELLSTLFMNNMDLMMRLKYETDLNTEQGGDGVLKGTTYADKINGDLSSHNPIHNGSFTILRGVQNTSIPSVKSFKGVEPDIEYKVIDMYDRSNEDILVSVFGANKGSFSYKADYLRDLDRDIINPVTGFPYTSKPFVVAKVTFYVDVVVPYFSPLIRELRGSIGGDVDNFLDIIDNAPEGVDGTRRVSYTRFFAVTP